MTRCSRHNLVLIGFMASGKSSVGRECARRLCIPFRDTDTWIERRMRKSVASIFEQDGESLFRKLETEAVRFLSSTGPLVLATGGGAPMNPVNADILRESGCVVLLWTTPAEIETRTSRRQSRPLLKDAENPLERITSLLKEREPVYRSVAHAVVDTTDLSREDSAMLVLEEYRSYFGETAWPA